MGCTFKMFIIRWGEVPHRRLLFFLSWSSWRRPHCYSKLFPSIVVAVVQSLSCVQLIVTPWTAAHQASLSFTISWSLLKLICIDLVMPSNHLVLCCPLLLLPSIFPNIRVFSYESAVALLAFIPLGPQVPCKRNGSGSWRGFCSASQTQDRSSVCLSGIFRLDGESRRFWNCASLIISFQGAKFI